MLYNVGDFIDLSVKKKEEPAAETQVFIPGTKIIFADLAPYLKVLKITPDLFIFNRTNTA